MGIKYTREQTQAIAVPEGDAAIVASAGAAKTSVLAWRIAYLLKRHGYVPRNIIALTYSSRAADELFDRITKTVEDKCGSVLEMADMMIGTFHSVAFHLLKSIPEYRKYEIIGEAERVLLIRRNFSRIGIGKIPRVGLSTTDNDAPRYLTRDPHDLALLIQVFDKIREEQLPIAILPPELRSALQAYKYEIHREAAFDYNSVLVTLLHVLQDGNNGEHAALQKRIAEEIRVIHLDESQDNSPLMWAICDRLREFGADVVAVGDLNQAIYRWRNAAPERLAHFASGNTNTRLLTLTSNFRSSSAIVDLANDFLRRFMPHSGSGNQITMLHASHLVHEHGDVAALRFSTQSEQYQWGARRLKAMLGTVWRDKLDQLPRGLSQSDMAVLCRTRRQMPEIAAALRAQGLDVVVAGAQGLLVPPEAEALATFVEHLGGNRATWDRKTERLTISPVAEDDVRVAVRAAQFGINEDAIENGLEFARALRASPDWHEPKCLIEMMEQWLQVMGVQFADAGSTTEEVRWIAISRVLRAAASYSRWGFSQPLGDRVRGFAYWLRVEAPLVCKDEEAEEGLHVKPDAVALTTLHAAKGLEWPLIWMPDLQDGQFPLRPRESDLWAVLPQSLLTPEQRRRMDGPYHEKLSDEHRLAYVGITRAARYLLATYAPHPKSRFPRPSPYLTFLESHPATTRDLHLLPSSAAPDAERLPPLPRQETASIQTTFSQLHNYTICPRAFYLRHVLRVPPPLNENIGFGSSVHSACWEIHERAMNGKALNDTDIEAVACKHLSLPFASAGVQQGLRNAAVRALRSYVTNYLHSKQNIESAEQEVRLDLGPITLLGRIDLAYRDDKGRLVLDEIKLERGLGRDEQMLIAKAYALAYEQSRGCLPDRVGVRSLLNQGDDAYRSIVVTKTIVDDIKSRVIEAGQGIARRHFIPLPIKAATTCSECDAQRLCRHRQNISEDIV